jgi:protein phosphatase 1L
MTHRISADAHVQLDNNLVQLPSSAHPWMIPQPIQSSIKALRHAFETIDTEILRVSHWSFQGSTAVTVLLQSLDDTTTLPSGNSMASNAHGPPYPLTALIAANVGDSRAVLCRAGMAINLTNDHKPNHPLERIRIEKFGGKVQYCKAHGSREVIDHHNTYILGSGQAMSRGVYRINGNLALSRALGDRSERPLISSEVDISYTVLNPATDEFIILASDGLWDVFDTSQDVVNLVHWLLNKERTKIHDGPSDQSLRQDLARLLVQEAVRRGSTDNISVAIIYLV